MGLLGSVKLVNGFGERLVNLSPVFLLDRTRYLLQRAAIGLRDSALHFPSIQDRSVLGAVENAEDKFSDDVHGS
jgi:hypothetical protein